MILKACSSYPFSAGPQHGGEMPAPTCCPWPSWPTQLCPAAPTRKFGKRGADSSEGEKEDPQGKPRCPDAPSLCCMGLGELRKGGPVGQESGRGERGVPEPKGPSWVLMSLPSLVSEKLQN